MVVALLGPEEQLLVGADSRQGLRVARLGLPRTSRTQSTCPSRKWWSWTQSSVASLYDQMRTWLSQPPVASMRPGPLGHHATALTPFPCALKLRRPHWSPCLKVCRDTVPSLEPAARMSPASHGAKATVFTLAWCASSRKATCQSPAWISFQTSTRMSYDALA